MIALYTLLGWVMLSMAFLAGVWWVTRDKKERSSE